MKGSEAKMIEYMEGAGKRYVIPKLYVIEYITRQQQ